MSSSSPYKRGCRSPSLAHRWFPVESPPQEFPANEAEIIARCYPIETVTKFELKTTEAEGWITIRRDLRGSVGLLAAPLGIALIDTAGINVDPLAVVSPTRIDVHLFEPAADKVYRHPTFYTIPQGVKNI